MTAPPPPPERFVPRAGEFGAGTEFVLRPVGVVRSALADPAVAPRQGAIAGTEAEIEVFPPYAAALLGVAVRAAGAVPAPDPAPARPLPPAGEEARKGRTVPGTGKIVILCFLDRADRDALSVHPGGDPASPRVGVFATRSPHRPNPVSLHTVELLAVRGNVLRVRGMDAVDGTPVVDIKPYVAALDG